MHTVNVEQMLPALRAPVVRAEPGRSVLVALSPGDLAHRAAQCTSSR